MNIDSDYWLKGVLYPQRRGMLILYLLDLSDEEYQKFVWVNPKGKTGFYSNLYYPIGLMLEEENLEEGDNAIRNIGGLCKNKEEALAVKEVATLLDAITDITRAPDEYYLNSPLYKPLVNASKEAFKIFMQTEQDNKEFVDFMEEVRKIMLKEIEEGKAKRGLGNNFRI